MQKQFVIKSRGLFAPHSDEPFKVSRSGIELFLECPRCFYLNHRLGIRRPSGPPFTINSLVDRLLKKEFDVHRADGTAHPLMKSYGIDAVPYQHPQIDEWRQNFKGIRYLHAPTNLLITGAVDDLWCNPEKEVMVVDYKATAKSGEVTIDAEWQQSYKRQMEVYQWLVRRQDLTVSDTGYFVYCNGQDGPAFDGRIEFSVKLLPYTGSDAWVEDAIHRLRACLFSEDISTASKDCEFCGYVSARWQKEPSGQDPFECRDEVKTGLDCYSPEFRLFPKLSKRVLELTKRDVLLILKWKLNRLKKDHASIIEDQNVRKLNDAIAMAQSPEYEQRHTALTSLMEIHGVKLAVATAFLTVCYPDEFTIIDRRVLEQLGYPEERQDTSKWTPEDYLRIYLPEVRKRSRQWNTTLRDADRALWGLSVDHQIGKILKGSDGGLPS